MSNSERHRRSRLSKGLCAACQGRKARFSYRREVRADRDHTLCFECYRGEINRARARQLPQSVNALHASSLFGVRHSDHRGELDERQLAHRQRMLVHLQGTRTVASGLSCQNRGHD